MIEENCYVLWDDSHEAVVVDCGAFYPEERKAIADFIADNGLLVKRLLQTHAHFDHLFGADFICRTYGVRPEMHRAEADTYAAAAEQSRIFMHRVLPLTLPPVGPYFDDGDDLACGDETSLMDSLKQRVLTLPDAVTVCPGHGDCTTVGEERRANPYLQ